ncbi:TRAP transporter small permease [Billgrantia bachuensis]|uniref:TRAP transporter small permease protein n=1 Tax=Billgrantia bachuensis TaxID=2717286 RepID=A0ABX0PLZ0_9GAMM|nr:TRAP transporter small permease [Halomonas bachuensis]NIC04128.1 TRAP transporter small permease [Halomonas bachuensis]
MVELFLRFERATSRVALAAAVLMLCVSVTTGFYQVLTRFVFDAPSTWSEVVARSSMIWCVFLAAAACFRGGYMMSVEVIYKMIPARRLILLEGAIALGCLVALAVLVYFGTAMTFRVRNQMLSGLGISISWVYAAIPIGAGFSVLAVLARLVAQATGREAVGLADVEAEAPPAETLPPVTADDTPTPSAIVPNGDDTAQPTRRSGQ